MYELQSLFSQTFLLKQSCVVFANKLFFLMFKDIFSKIIFYLEQIFPKWEIKSTRDIKLLLVKVKRNFFLRLAQKIDEYISSVISQVKICIWALSESFNIFFHHFSMTHSPHIHESEMVLRQFN